jgi:hypothetical protein
MAQSQRYEISGFNGINLFVNPLQQNKGDLIRAVNVTSDQYGSLVKRPGYSTYLGTPDGSAPQSLFSFYRNDGSTFYNYRASGSVLYSSAQGTGAWTVTGNGTIGAGAHVGAAILDNTMIVGDGVGSTRHSTDGTSFTNTTLAPIGEFFEQYQNRIHIGGTSSSDFYSTTGDATNWNTSGTSDSSSITIPGAGKMGRIFRAADRLVLSKNSGNMNRYDGYSLVDMSTDLGPTSPYSVDKTEDYWFWVNRLGLFGYDGSRPQILSNAVQKYFYNNSGSATPGSTFNTLPGRVHRYDYFAALGTTTDDFTGETVNNAVLKYDYQKNQFLIWSLANLPTSFNSYKDVNGIQQLIFGASGGQCYQFNGTATTDNGTAIESIVELMIDCDIPELEKTFDYLDLFFNPGCQAHVQIATSSNFSRESKRWVDIGDVTRGHVQFKFPRDSRDNFLFLKVTDVSIYTPFRFYGLDVWYSLNARD